MCDANSINSKMNWINDNMIPMGREVRQFTQTPTGQKVNRVMGQVAGQVAQSYGPGGVGTGMVMTPKFGLLTPERVPGLAEGKPAAEAGQGEDFLEMIRRRSPGEIPKTPEQIQAENDRIETMAAERRVDQQGIVGGKKKVTQMTPQEPDEAGIVTAINPSRVEGYSIYTLKNSKGQTSTLRFNEGKWKIGDTVRGTKIPLSDVDPSKVAGAEGKLRGPRLVK